MDIAGEPGSGLVAMAMLRASAFTSCCVHLLSKYTPPTTTGCGNRGCDIQTNAAVVLVASGRYGVECGMWLRTLYVHDW